jgi:hypothetical protein
MLLDVIVFLGRQGTGFAQQSIGNRELADIVKQGSRFHGAKEVGVHRADFHRQGGCIASNALRVLEGRQVARGHCSRQRKESR